MLLYAIVPSLLALPHLQYWQFFLVFMLISHMLFLLQIYFAEVLFCRDRRKKALQLKQDVAP
jgi:hypothetical protein